MLDSLRSLSDHQLISRTELLALRERKLALSVLVHLNEIERRKLHLTLGYSSMFDYCTRRLLLSQPAAARRLRTARSLARFPELYPMLEAGEVNLSTISLVSKILKRANFDTVMHRIRGKSQREVRSVVAEYEPRSVLPPDRVIPVVVPVPIGESLLLGSTDEHCRSDSEKSPSPAAREDRRPGDDQRSPGATVSSSVAMKLERRAVVQFTAREEVVAKLDRVRSLASHRLRGHASLEDVIELLADEFIKREDPSLRQARREQRVATKPVKATATSPRQIPVRVRDEVFVRDRQQCTYVSPSGKRCASTHVLQVDHVKPIARGGTSTIGNLRLLCAYHNRLEAERLMGLLERLSR